MSDAAFYFHHGVYLGEIGGIQSVTGFGRENLVRPVISLRWKSLEIKIISSIGELTIFVWEHLLKVVKIAHKRCSSNLLCTSYNLTTMNCKHYATDLARTLSTSDQVWQTLFGLISGIITAIICRLTDYLAFLIVLVAICAFTSFSSFCFHFMVSHPSETSSCHSHNGNPEANSHSQPSTQNGNKTFLNQFSNGICSGRTKYSTVNTNITWKTKYKMSKLGLSPKLLGWLPRNVHFKHKDDIYRSHLVVCFLFYDKHYIEQYIYINW